MVLPLIQAELGGGVIDCALDRQGRLVAACDVSGRLVVTDQSLHEMWSYEFSRPLWGVAISSELGIVATALASKAEQSGALVVLEYPSGKTLHSIETQAPAWDCIIDEKSKVVYASTWGNGVSWVNLRDGGTGRIPFQRNTFGLSIIDDTEQADRLLGVTVEGLGVVVTELNPGVTDWTAPTARSVLTSKFCCYKHDITAQGREVYAGSSTGVLLRARATPPTTSDYRTRSVNSPLRDVCSVAVIRDFVLHGSLKGELLVAQRGQIGMPLGIVSTGDAVWSMRYDDASGRLWIANGDGSLAQYDADSICRSAFNDEIEEIAFGPGSLGGASVFISYASEDRQEATALYRFLKTVGCRPWIDHIDILPGQDWRAEISRSLKNSDYVVICLSRSSVSKRGYVQREVKQALDMLDQVPNDDIYLIPGRLEECVIPDQLATRQWVDLFSEDGYRRLCMSIYAGRQRNQE